MRLHARRTSLMSAVSPPLVSLKRRCSSIRKRVRAFLLCPASCALRGRIRENAACPDISDFDRDQVVSSRLCHSCASRRLACRNRARSSALRIERALAKCGRVLRRSM